MKLRRFAWFGLALLLGCSRGPEGSNAARSATASASAAPGAELSSGVGIGPAPCSPNAYRHEDPDFCVELPAAARGKAPTAIENGITFPGVVVEWRPKSDAALVAEWKAPRPRAQHEGRFEIWTTEPMPRGTFFVIHDATQHKTADIFKVPSVSGVAVVEGETTIVRCTSYYNLERDEDARAIAESHAAELAACKSLRLFGAAK